MTQKDSTSLLVCGAKGVGKSALVDRCLKSFDQKHIKVRLNGLLHATDAICIRFIAKELGIDDSDLSKFSVSLRKFCQEENTKVVFVLDLFDIFCRKQQTLLYNLFDISQQTGNICIIGMTTRLDCIELLEKRVKSRMNQRVIVLSAPYKSLQEYFEFAEFLLEGKLKIEGTLKDKLRDQYSKNTSVLSLKHFLLSFLLSIKEEQKISEKDAKVDAMCSLSYLNLSVLFLAFKFTQTHKTQTFNCFSLLPLLCEIPTQITVTKPLLFHAVNELIECGLIVIVASSKFGLYLTEWTSLSLTIDEIHIKTALTACENNLPLKMKQLLGTLQ
ncbi:hypothetical protein B4U79_17835 [Dinothrombium tinctorium]|uniref:ATPase AAA-type core domain-containing protein n=1 Tax=Dinothrombium tinctorium TaxID=1965070 RepID=A0A3S4RLP9_9ACAR|nr:hypothetical protein B4U79_17835 [Dinothrombium tinctorium]